MRSIYVDFQDIREYREAVAIAHAAGAEIWLATPRIQKPDELGIFHALAKHGANGILVRNLAGLRFYRERGIRTVADFSLNCANELTASYLSEQGAERITASYDLNRDQLLDLVGRDRFRMAGSGRSPAHAHVPHGALRVLRGAVAGDQQDQLRAALRHAPGQTARPAGHGASAGGRRRLPQHAVQCRAAKCGGGRCRNCSPPACGSFRVELLDAAGPALRDVLDLYQRLLAGAVTAKEVWSKLQASNRVGVTRGTLEERRNPLAIL